MNFIEINTQENEIYLINMTQIKHIKELQDRTLIVMMNGDYYIINIKYKEVLKDINNIARCRNGK